MFHGAVNYLKASKGNLRAWVGWQVASWLLSEGK